MKLGEGDRGMRGSRKGGGERGDIGVRERGERETHIEDSER